MVKFIVKDESINNKRKDKKIDNVVNWTPKHCLICNKPIRMRAEGVLKLYCSEQCRKKRVKVKKKFLKWRNNNAITNTK